MSAATAEQPTLRKVTHCIFDMDGLLLDTERLYSEAAQLVLDEFGKKYTFEVKQQVMGLQTRPLSEQIVAAFDLPLTWEEYAERQREHARILMRNAGLMPDTETIHEQVVRQIAADLKRDYPNEVRFRVLGTSERRSAEIAVEECQIPLSVDEFLKRCNALCIARFGNVPLMKGAERLLRHLHGHSVPIALATSSGADMVELKTANHRELFELFNHRVCGSTDEEVKNGKPAPDIFLVAASRFADKPDPTQCLVFEDSPNGIVAGKTAGMQTVMVPDPRLAPELRANATQVIASLEDFKPEQYGLPAFSA